MKSEFNQLIITYGYCNEAIAGFYLINPPLVGENRSSCVLLSMKTHIDSGLYLQKLALTTKKIVILLQAELLRLLLSEMDRLLLHGLTLHIFGLTREDLLAYRKDFPYFTLVPYSEEQSNDGNKIVATFFNFTDLQYKQ